MRSHLRVHRIHYCRRWHAHTGAHPSYVFQTSRVRWSTPYAPGSNATNTVLFTSGRELADTLTAHLREICHDLHLTVGGPLRNAHSRLRGHAARIPEAKRIAMMMPQ